MGRMVNPALLQIIAISMWRSRHFDLGHGLCSYSPNKKTSDHTRTKAQSPQTNGICERFHKTILNEFYQVAFRKKIYATLEELQVDLDAWIDSYNHERTHQGKMCCGRTPMATFEDGKRICREKSLNLN